MVRESVTYRAGGSAPGRDAPLFPDVAGVRDDGGLDAVAFQKLAAAWRALGYWLTGWSSDGQLRLQGDGPVFWTKSWRGSGALRSALASAVRRILDCAQMPDDAAHYVVALPGPGLVRLIGVPVRRRRRLVGVCVAAGGVERLDDEAFRRFCDAAALDAAASRMLLESESPGPAVAPEALAGLLSAGVELCAASATASREIESLARNLESTYEELSLIYRISAEMGVSTDPGTLLRSVAEQTVSVSRAAGVAFLRHGKSADGDDATVLAQAGCDNVAATSLGRLAYMLVSGLDPSTEHVIANGIGDGDGFRWARPWLRHSVAFPLRHGTHHLGTMLAVNCNDGGDFTSVDVQLLRAVGDRVAAFLNNQRLYDDLADLLMGLLHALINSIDAKDPYTCGHSERVAFLSRRLAEAAGLSAVDSQRVYLAGLLHDVGKIGVADAILCKPGRLTPEEFDELRKHPEIGARILSRIPQVRDLLPGVLYHHERIDGRGYPHRLRGGDIPLLARIICLADCLDAMTTTRTYRAFLPPRLAVAEIRRCAGTQFDAHLAEALLRLDVPRVLAEAHEFAGSRLPDAQDARAPVPDTPVHGFSSRPIFTREMFATQVTGW